MNPVKKYERIPACETDAGYTDGALYEQLILAGETYSAAPPTGEIPGAVYGDHLTYGRALGGNFGAHAGDFVRYAIQCPPGAHMKIQIRACGNATFMLGGCASGEITFATEDFFVYTIPIGAAGGALSLTLRCTEPGSGVVIDMLAAADTPVRF